MQKTKKFSLEFLLPLDQGTKGIIGKEAARKNCNELETHIISHSIKLRPLIEIEPEISFAYNFEKNAYNFEISMAFPTNTDEEEIKDIKTCVENYIKTQELPWHQIKDKITSSYTSYSPQVSNLIH